MRSLIYPVTTETAADTEGGFQAELTDITTNFPIADATVAITSLDNPSRPMEVLRTDSAGFTPFVNLPAPPFALSQEPSDVRPYSEYVLDISAPGYEPIRISGAEILAGVTARQRAQLLPSPAGLPDSVEEFTIPDHTLYGSYPPKIAEAEVKETISSGEIVLPSVVIPEFVIVHDGTPNNTRARNYTVRYRDYIKNVASSEIYATWPEATIYANILAIMSFTLNRVYTEWYRSRGYDFTITSSTAYDHKWIPERNIYDTIDAAVDNIFNNYLSRPNVKQPILTQYCDGKQVSCPGLMTQWGSKSLGDQGYTPIQILRNFYGNSIYINSTEQISGIPASYPGAALRVGSRGNSVRTIQEQLNVISNAYPRIPKVAEDGVFGKGTEEAVRTFQEVFNLTPDGIVGFNTWYKISAIYVAVSRIAEYM
ncbi:MAG: peptidoglycan-binding protein [Lachnospiraceae bacterium]|nr:peptidoglycan-binding protein [Lachnospiraceae bacterium]MBP3610118.1 peptidoglycan-binding protein [Lachnospiraceae bacterium]